MPPHMLTFLASESLMGAERQRGHWLKEALKQITHLRIPITEYELGLRDKP